MWELSDLAKDQTTVTLFCFRDSHDALVKLKAGTLVALVRAELLPSREGRAFALSASRSNDVVVIARCADYAVCKGIRTSDQKPCTIPVNKAHCAFCV